MRFGFGVWFALFVGCGGCYKQNGKGNIDFGSGVIFSIAPLYKAGIFRGFSTFF
jgi:hypothetical protein